MAVIGKVVRNSKKNFLGGGMGVLIPLALRHEKDLNEGSDIVVQDGYQPTEDESGLATGQDE